MADILYAAIIIFVFCMVAAVELVFWVVESVFNLLSPAMWY